MSLLAAALLLTGGRHTWAHPGNTDAEGCHVCRTNCEQWGYEYGERHCHGGGGQEGGGGETATTSPPTSSPPESPTTTSAPAQTPGTEPTSQPRATTTTTQLEPLLPPEVTVVAPTRSEPDLIVSITGEPRIGYRITVQSELQVKTGRLDMEGRAEERFRLPNGDHTATVVLLGPGGVESESVTKNFSVSILRPAKPLARVTSDEGKNPVVVEISGGPADGTGVVRTDSGDEQATSLDASGSGFATLDLEDGEYTLTVVVEDYQGQASDETVIGGVRVGDPSSGDDLIGGLVLLGLTGLGVLWIFRRRRGKALRSAGEPESERATTVSEIRDVPTAGRVQEDDPPPPPPDGPAPQ